MQLLQMMLPAEMSSVQVQGASAENLQKNRFPHILPGSHICSHICTQLWTSEVSNWCCCRNVWWWCWWWWCWHLHCPMIVNVKYLLFGCFLCSWTSAAVLNDTGPGYQRLHQCCVSWCMSQHLILSLPCYACLGFSKFDNHSVLLIDIYSDEGSLTRIVYSGCF